jgi:basic amino acid/polyamine antiporter, APA family
MNDSPTSAEGLSRRLGTRDAVVIGLSSMIGAGVFAVFGPAARAAGAALLVGLVVAAVIAYCNAVASAQLAMAYPTSGGTYIYGRERLGHWWGFVAGWGFVIGKTASCAAMALTFASYLAPGPWWAQRLVAVAGVVGLTALNYRGVAKTAWASRVLVAAALLALAVVVLGIGMGTVLGGDTSAGAGAGSAGAGSAGAGAAGAAPGAGGRLGGSAPPGLSAAGVYGVLQAAGLLFFAFAGYARIATMGEEVREPKRTIPKAIPLALGITVVVYLLVGSAALLAAGPDRLAASVAPLTTAVEAAGIGAAAPVVRAGAVLASLGALLALVAGVGRTILAMARHRDLPAWLSAVHPRYRVPHHAELALAVVVCALAATVDLRGVIGFSSFGVLVYYAIANAAAFTQESPDRRWPRGLNVLGLVGCLVLVASLPVGSVVAGLVIFAVGVGGRAVVLSRRRSG